MVSKDYIWAILIVVFFAAAVLYGIVRARKS